MAEQPQYKGRPSLLRAALFGLCPKCNEPGMFVGTMSIDAVQFAPKCSRCGLDYDGFNVGDGPAAFLTMIIGTILIILAMLLEGAAHPPIWVHALLWIPLTIIGTVFALRLAKGMLLTLEYQNKAKETGRDDIVGMDNGGVDNARNDNIGKENGPE
ncbi:hypothetical protein LPB140_03860 [Sphingorhabdus lutea]|uniref:DUF983 domain-containing protein n=1 Tax=Sphingorhabdus lutea TaxID=1913578 RepID=A0A1L3JAD8_9SPHN|nr:DUF983 domain-containing protein [Sphingorhabdus lutea]APG62088.1 hypothetical protein LPB140_03860 [Sphingorhabdus lutea]